MNKKPIQIWLSDKEYAALVKLALADKRSLKNYTETIVSNHLKEKSNGEYTKTP